MLSVTPAWQHDCNITMPLLLQILALMLLRQRGMRLTIISILEDLAIKLPPVRRNIELVRLQFAQRFKHEDLMMQQITPPGFNAAEKVCLVNHQQLLPKQLYMHALAFLCFLMCF